MVKETVINQFRGIFEKALLEEIAQHATLVAVNEGDVLMDYGQHIRSMPIILSGSVKIVREDEDGKEVFLYYVNAKETCAMSLTCCMGNAQSRIRATMEDQGEILMLPVIYMDEWMRRFSSWRQFVIQAYQNRFEELLGAVDLLAFKKMDERIATYLHEKAKIKEAQTLRITHGEIAQDLGTSREVVSRILKALEKEGQIALGRNKVTLLG
ncbi:Crp/Fnr family transcriptional regulator [Persicobacter psychrovividus]|uniref:Crp/Fnr family transcriptional regulator n=1 Tax=Persicobacter psychrovividus TaxID=387638 RepID=A0ABN6LEC4_9BACT|nr:Crp/Fnr family transcriptional regulator [Persicobacter psychrovividus]